MTRLLALVMSVSLLLPAFGGALAVLAGAQSVVLCIGSERVRVTLDADGMPVETVAASDHDCLIAPTLDASVRSAPPTQIGTSFTSAWMTLPPSPRTPSI